MSAWFSRVGLPLTAAENAAIGALIQAVAPQAPFAVTHVPSWQEAGRLMHLTEHASASWDEEEAEREALWAHACESCSESELQERLHVVTDAVDQEIRDAAFAAVASAGAIDTDIATEAIAMALLAAHQSALAKLAGAAPGHRFVCKFALFEEGRWPLGYHFAHLAIF
jgi:hypothetical protein